MISRTKPELKTDEIQNMFNAAALGKVLKAEKLGDGEYNAVYDVVTDMGKYVLKVSPLDKTGILTYEQDMMRVEVFWYAQIRTHTKICVPYVYFKDFSHTVYPSDYFIMERMEGEQLNSADLTTEEKAECEREIARMTAQMHKVTNNKYGYIQNTLFDCWYDALRNMIENLIDDAKRAGKASKRGQKLEKCRDILNTVPCVMVNADLWYGNILCVKNGGKFKLILIDPERSFWGDPIFDFVNLDFARMLNKKTRTLEAYNSSAKVPIKCTRDEMIRFALSLGYLALVMETEKYYRYSPKHFGWWRNIFSSKFLYDNAFKILKRELK
ncbi:MAG: phosphotransferase family protein [Eubacterium sp.]